MSPSTSLNELSKIALVACEAAYAGSGLFDKQALAEFIDRPDSGANPLPYSVPAGYEVDFTNQNDVNGFKLVAFRHTSTAEVILAFAGTDGSDPIDWRENLKLGWGQWDASGRAALQQYFAQLDAQQVVPSRICFAGQSLGGALAEYAAFEFINSLGGDKDKVSLVTFNGLGSKEALIRYGGFAEDTVGAFSLGVDRVAHYFVTNDLIHRLGGGHIGGAAYELAFLEQEINPRTGKPFLLDPVTAHRIETGFYRQFALSTGGTDTAHPYFMEARAATVHLIPSSDVQPLIGDLVSIFGAKQGATPLSAEYASKGALILGIRDAPPGALEQLLRPFLLALYNSGEIGLDQYDFLSRRGLDALKSAANTFSDRGVRYLLTAAVMEKAAVNETPTAEDIERVKELILDQDGLSSFGSLGVEFYDSNDRVHRAMAYLTGSRLIDPSNADAQKLMEGLGIDPTELTRRIVTSNDANRGIADYLFVKLNAQQGDMATLVGLLSGSYGRIRQQSTDDVVIRKLDPEGAFRGGLVAETRSFLKELAGATANAYGELSRKVEGVAHQLSTTIEDWRTFSGFSAAYSQQLERDDLGPSLREILEEALKIIQQAGQLVFVRPGRGTNPFDDPGFDPASVPLVQSQLPEASLSTFSVYLPYEAGAGGQSVALELSGADIARLAVLADGEQSNLQEDGSFVLTVPEGQREATFSIVASADFDADRIFTLSAGLVDMSGDATHVRHEEAVIAVNGETESAPSGGREIRGDWAPKEYIDPSTGQIFYAFDDLGNIEREPGAPNAANYREPDASLSGSAGADHIVTGDSADVVHAFDGDDSITAGDLYGNILLGGAGNDWVEAGGYEGHAADYIEFERFGRTVKLGEDKIYGGAGDDQLYGDSEASVNALYDPSVTPTGRPGDWISGGSGDDKVFGGAGDDVLMGGLGEDRLVGGAGMDVLIGDDDFGIAVQGNFWTVVHPNFGSSEPGFGDFEFGLFPVYNYHPNLQFPALTDPNSGDPYVSYYKEGGGADVLIGGAGKDILIGQLGDDTLYGGEDDDLLAGWEGADSIHGGAGNDRIAGDFGRYEQPSQRIISSIELAMPGLRGSPSFDGSVVDQVGNDFLDGGSGNDTIFGEGGDDVVLGGDGNDTLFGDANYLPEELHGDDLLDGGIGDDFLSGGSGDDKLYGGDGNDELAGGSGDDLLEGGAGNDVLAGGEGDDLLRGGEGADSLLGAAGADQLRGGGGDDQLAGNEDDDVIYGDSGADAIDGGAGADTLYGGSGDDIIDGGDGDDLIDGGAGIDVVRGGAGNDTYVVGVGYGQDLIDDSEGQNRIRFGAGILPEDLGAELDSVTLAATLTFGAAGDSLAFDAGEGQIAGVEFSGGATWTKIDLVNFLPAVFTRGSGAGEIVIGNPNLRNELLGEGGHDDLKGGSYDDVFAGGGGYDSLDGSGGSDRYFFAADDSGIDFVSDSGLAARAYLDWFYGSRGIADWAERGEHGGEYRAEGEGEGGVFTAYFETLEEAHAQYPNATITYLEPLPEIAALIARDDAQALAELSSEGLLDHDVVKFGAGLTLADLGLTITVRGPVAGLQPERPWHGGGTLSVRWGAAGFNVEVPDANYGFVGTNLLTDGDRQEEESVDGSWRGYRLGEGIEAFEFADGTKYTLEQILQQAIVVQANDYLVARGSGIHVVDAATYTGIRFEEGISASGVRVERSGTDLSVSLADLSASVLLEGWFADPPGVPNLSLRFESDPAIDASLLTRLALTQKGTEFNDELDSVDGFTNELYGHDGHDTLIGGTGDDVLLGGGGEDMLFGGEGADTLDGGPGNDFLQGGGGDDVYVFGNGSGQDAVSEDEDSGGGSDTIRLSDGVLPADVMVNRDYVDLRLSLSAGDDAMTVFGWFSESRGSVERVAFPDGTSWDAAAIEALLPAPEAPTAGGDSLQGLTGDDVLAGLDGDDEIYGYAGDDTLEGGGGYDYVAGGRGNDIYLFSLGDGTDEFEEEGGHDRIIFGHGIDPADVALEHDQYSLFVTIGEADDALMVWNWLYDPADRIEQIEFTDGTVWNEEAIWSLFEPALATEEDDVLTGTNRSDVLDGLDGNDELWGYDGNDILHGGAGDDYIEGAFGSNLLEGGEGADLLAQEGLPGRNLLIGGKGDDELAAYTGPSVVAFNAGDGIDSVNADSDQPLTISLGGFEAGEVGLSRESDSRIMIALPGGEALAVQGFALGRQRAGATLQLVGPDVQTYDLDGLVRAFDEAQEFDPEGWSMAAAMQDHLLSVSTTHAVGGAIAYQYATAGTTGALSVASKQSVLGDANFAVAAQSIIAQPANRAPTLENAVADQDASEDAAFQFTVPAGAFSDPDQDALAYFASLPDGSELPPWLTFNAAARSFSGTPLQPDVGAIDIRVSVQDEGGLSATDAFVLTVLNVNDAPAARMPIPGQFATEDLPFAFSVSAESFADEDPGDLLAWYAAQADDTALPPWLSFDAGTRTLSGVPDNGAVGVLDVRVAVADRGGLTASQIFTLSVENVNDAPVAAVPIADQSFDVGSPFSFAISPDTFADVDAGDTLTLAASQPGGRSLPAWLTFEAGAGVFSGNPATTDIGIFDLQVVASDAAGASALWEFALVLRAVAGSSVTGGGGSDALYGGSGDETLTAKGGSDYLFGDVGDDLLKGGAGNDALQGGEGADVLRGGSGQNLLDGGAGDDLIFGGKGAGLIAGGAGNDTIRTGSGADVILFNRGDGVDTLISDREGDNTLSFGGGIRYSDLSFSKEGKNLVVNAGGEDRVVLKNWYGGKRSVLSLQIVLDASEDFDASSADPLYNKRVQSFDFSGLVSAFDTARAATPGLTSWALTNALLEFHLSGLDDMAMGGDLAYWYGRNRTFAGISLAAAQQVIGAPGFGSEAQMLRPFSGLQEGFIKLS